MISFRRKKQTKHFSAGGGGGRRGEADIQTGRVEEKVLA